MKYPKLEVEKSLKNLKLIVQNGDTLHTILRHCSRSGMMRTIGIVRISDNGNTQDLTMDAAKVLGLSVDRDKWGVKVSGCGMDMGFHVVYSLAQRLFPKGHSCAGEKCRSNDHTNGEQDRSGTLTHNDGGYALSHRWL